MKERAPQKKKLNDKNNLMEIKKKVGRLCNR